MKKLLVIALIVTAILVQGCGVAVKKVTLLQFEDASASIGHGQSKSNNTASRGGW